MQRSLLALLAVVLALVAGSLLITDVRWRMEVAGMKATGKLQALNWAELLPMLKPGSDFWLQPLIESPNPYAVIFNPRSTPHDVKTGRALFRARCSMCHGPGATGGTAPPLAGRDLVHGSSAWALFQTVRNGIADTPMAPHDLPADDVWRLVAYIQDLNTVPAPTAVSPMASDAPRPTVSFDALRTARSAADDWPTHHGSYNGQRYSSLAQIHRGNVAQLQARWLYQLPVKGGRIQATPLAAGGMLFLTDAEGGVVALDGATGIVRWRFARPSPHDVPLCCVVANRGVALLDGKVFVVTLDAHLIALDGSTGKKLWEREVADPRKGYSSTGAPLAVKGMIVTGIAGSEFGATGFVAAFDAADGRPVWRFDTIPQPGEKHNDTWAGDSWRTGGVATWMTGTYDPELDLIFWGTANPAPDYDASLRAGDNLYANCIVALQADTGKLVWHFQSTPGDDHDWDAVQTPVLADIVAGGTTHKLLLQANRNGFFYGLERSSGKFIRATAYVKQTWAERVDETGRAHKRPEATPSIRGVVVYPGTAGATNWWPPTFSPAAQLFIAPAIERPGIFFKTAVNERRREGAKLLAGSSSGTMSTHYTAVRALDPLTGERRWEYRSADRRNDAYLSGLLSTAGGLVFTSDQSKLIGLDIENGHELWSFHAGGAIFNPPSTFMAQGEQFVTFAAGDVLVGLALPRAAVRATERAATSHH